MQQNPESHLFMSGKHCYSNMFAGRAEGAQSLPDLGGVVGDQARNRYRQTFRERCLARKGSHELAEAPIEHELKFTCLSTLNHGSVAALVPQLIRLPDRGKSGTHKLRAACKAAD